MANEVEPKLTNELFEELQGERFVTISTIDYENGGPNVSAISWVFARNEQTVLFAVDSRSRIVQNIKNNQMVVLTLMANESTFSIQGNAEVKAEKVKGVPLSLSIVEMRIIEVRDVMFYGSKIVEGPVYNKTYDPKAALRLDKQVMDILKKA